MYEVPTVYYTLKKRNQVGQLVTPGSSCVSEHPKVGAWGCAHPPCIAGSGAERRISPRNPQISLRSFQDLRKYSPFGTGLTVTPPLRGEGAGGEVIPRAHALMRREDGPCGPEDDMLMSPQALGLGSCRLPDQPVWPMSPAVGLRSRTHRSMCIDEQCQMY